MPKFNLSSKKLSYYENEVSEDRRSDDRQARRKRKPKVHYEPKKEQTEILTELADTTALEAGFKPTYQPSRYEEGWLLSSLEVFYDQALITDVLAQVRGGKEASVYRCQADPATGVSLLAAKVYRPRMFRQLRNDKMYREGRAILSESGQAIKTTDHRIMRALGKKTDYGVQVEHTSWLMYEYTTLKKLHEAGAAVPKPYATSENAILMTYCGDTHLAAPILNEVTLDADETLPLFKTVMFNIELMLQNDLIHGDLSAYNILYWEGNITLIDFPQVANSRTNPHAYEILHRDIARVCDYFAKQGIDRDPHRLADALWTRYALKSARDQEADASRFLEKSEEEDDE